jgi:hypothetical protein
MDRVNDPTMINFSQDLLEDTGLSFSDMRGLRVRNPLHVEDQLGYLIFDVPMIIHEKPKFSAAVSRTNNGPESITFSYRTTKNGDWTTDGLGEHKFTLNTAFELIELDFEEVEEVKNNPDFQIRIDFEGNTSSNSGNVRFNNISVEAFPLTGDDLVTNIPLLPKEETLPVFNKIYPNPFSEKLYLDINEKALHLISSIQILDSRGVEVMRMDNLDQSIQELDMSLLSTGLYVIKVVSSIHLETYKIIKK